MSTPTRSEIRHLAANKLSIVMGNAQLILNDPDVDIKARHRAKIIDREARDFMDALLAMFKEPEVETVSESDPWNKGSVGTE